MLMLLRKSATSLRSDEVSKVFALDPFPRSSSLCSDDVSKVFCSDDVSKVFCSDDVSIEDEEDDVSRLSKVSSK